MCVSVVLHLGIQSRSHTINDCFSWYFVTSSMSQILIISVISSRFYQSVISALVCIKWIMFLNLKVLHKSCCTEDYKSACFSELRIKNQHGVNARLLSISPLWQQSLGSSVVPALPSPNISCSGCISVVVPPPAWVGRSLTPARPSSFSSLSFPSSSLARTGRSLLAKRLGKEARRRERRTEKEPPSSAVSSGLSGTSEEFLRSGEEESFRSSGLGVVELG